MKIPGFRSKTPWKMALAGFCYGLVLMVAVIAIINPSSPPTDATTIEAEHDEVSAAFWGQQFVKQSIKSPGTAKFPPTATALALGEGRYLYQAYVDAQNNLGGTIRSNFKCYVKYDNGNWECESLEFLE